MTVSIKRLAGGDDTEGIVVPEAGGAVVEVRRFRLRRSGRAKAWN